MLNDFDSPNDNGTTITKVPITDPNYVWTNCLLKQQASAGSNSPIRSMAIRITQSKSNTSLFNNPADFQGILQGTLKASKFAYQIEKGTDTGKLHLQGYIKLQTKTRTSTIKKNLMIATNTTEAGLVWVTPAVDEATMMDYCTKEETRVMGPWSKPSSL